MGIETLLSNVKSLVYHYSDSLGNAGEMGFQVLGEEAVGGEAAWKVKWKIVPEGGEEVSVILWISKPAGKCLQVEVKGGIYTGEMAEIFAAPLLHLWYTWVGTLTEA